MTSFVSSNVGTSDEVGTAEVFTAVVSDLSDGHLQTMWVEVLKALEPKISRSQFITWFRDTTILGRDDITLIIGLPLPMFLNTHLESYRHPTLEAVQKVDATVKKLVYKVDGNLKDNRDRTPDILTLFPEQKRRKLPGKQAVRVAEGVVSKILNPRYTLENFVVGTSNSLAHAACQAVGRQPGGKYNPLFLYGGVGLGKTHLLQATGNAILQTNPKATVVYTTCEDFTNQVVEAIASRKMDKLRSRYRNVDALIIDDIQFLAGKERTQEEFFHTFNSLYEADKQIIISADRPPSELRLEDRLISRCSKGMIADVSKPDYETRLAILLDKARDYEMFIDAAVLQFIAEHITTSVRDLEGILMQAVAQYELEQRMPTIKSISELMSKLYVDPVEAADPPVGFEATKQHRITFQDIMAEVSGYYSVSVQDMVGSSRVRQVLLPRQIAMYLGKKHKNMAYGELGELFSNRDHTTVMNAVAKIKKVMQTDVQLMREVRAMERQLGLV